MVQVTTYLLQHPSPSFTFPILAVGCVLIFWLLGPGAAVACLLSASLAIVVHWLQSGRQACKRHATPDLDGCLYVHDPTRIRPGLKEAQECFDKWLDKVSRGLLMVWRLHHVLLPVATSGSQGGKIRELSSRLHFFYSKVRIRNSVD